MNNKVIFLKALALICIVCSCRDNLEESKNIAPKQDTIIELDSLSGVQRVKIFYKSGIKQSDLTIFNNRLNGICCYFYPNGKLKSIGNYIDGKAVVYRELTIEGDYKKDYNFLVDTDNIGDVTVNILTEDGKLHAGKQNLIFIDVKNVPASSIVTQFYSNKGFLTRDSSDLRRYFIYLTAEQKDSVRLSLNLHNQFDYPTKLHHIRDVKLFVER